MCHGTKCSANVVQICHGHGKGVIVPQSDARVQMCRGTKCSANVMQICHEKTISVCRYSWKPVHKAPNAKKKLYLCAHIVGSLYTNYIFHTSFTQNAVAPR